MTRRLVMTLAALLALAALTSAAAQARVAERGPARLQVGADEFFYSLSRARVKAGRAVIQLVNYGEDDHNLRLRRVGGEKTRRIARTSPGGMNELRTWLRSGRFDIWCSLPGHEALGMKARFRAYKPA